MNRSEASVAIVGGGPVGLNLALFLEKLGVRTVLFDREKSSRWHPKGSTHNSRTMEHYRWLGISKAIRSIGLPGDFPRDVAYFTRCNGWELARFRMSSEEESVKASLSAPATHQVPEPLVRTNQMYVERYLFDHIAQCNVHTRFGWEVVKIRQDESGASVTATCTDNGKEESWRVAFVVGCDGANSLVRKHLGISYVGHYAVENAFLDGAMVSSYTKMPTFLEDVARDKRAWMYNVVSSDSRLLLISLNGKDEYLVMSKGLHKGYVPGAGEIRRVVAKGIGKNIPITVVKSLPWTGGVALIAERFRERRFFLCGDSSHLFSPTGGFGMNTGIDDARNLSWKLAACIHGWGGHGLLSTYEEERRPIAERNTRAALFFTKRIGRIAIPEGLEDDTESGQRKRSTLRDSLLSLKSQFTALGVELGARYDGSSIIWEDGPTPPDHWEDYRPSSAPGGRLPHLWIDGGLHKQAPLRGSLYPRISVFDALSAGFTLLRVGPDAPSGESFALAARGLRIPFRVVDLPRQPAAELYEKKLILVRPDHHIAWRGDRIDTAPKELLERCAGRRLN